MTMFAWFLIHREPWWLLIKDISRFFRLGQKTFNKVLLASRSVFIVQPQLLQYYCSGENM